MSRVIRISETTFKRLEQHVRGFGDNPDTVIQRLLDHVDENQNINTGDVDEESRSALREKNKVVELDPDKPSDLTHTKVLGGHFNQDEIKNWKQLMHTAHTVAYHQLGSFDKLRKITDANIEKGHETRSGFAPALGVPISIQGASANKSWQAAVRLAQELNVPVEVRFRWRSKSKALHPGEQGKISWSPN